MCFPKVVIAAVILIMMGCSYLPVTSKEADNAEEILQILRNKVQASQIIPDFDWNNKTVLRPGIHIITIDFIGIIDKKIIDKISDISNDIKIDKKTKISLRFFRDRIRKTLSNGSIVNESVGLIETKE